MITYLQLKGWRNICEYLDGKWYKFANEYEIRCNCPLTLPALYLPKHKEHRRFLFDEHLIQFIRYQQHPVLDFCHSRRVHRQFGDSWGWRLCNDWEYKIQYLENLILFGKEAPKKWEPQLKSRLEKYKEREQKLKELEELKQMEIAERKTKANSLGLCSNCFASMIPFMVDCLICKKEY